MPIHPNARRCSHILLNKKQCGAPAVTGEQYCRFHTDVALRRRENAVNVPILQTAADIQLAITDTIRALIEGRIDRLRAGTILFGLQLAQNGLRIGNFPNVKFVGDLEDIDPAQRSVIMPALDDRQSIDEYEAEQEAAEMADAQAEAAAAARDSQHFANYAQRAADHAERRATFAKLKPTDWELAMAEALKRAPREFLDSIPRDEFGDVHPTPEQQQEISRMARAIFDTNRSPTNNATKKPSAAIDSANAEHLEEVSV